MKSDEDKSKSTKAAHKIKPVGADGHRKRMADRFLCSVKAGYPAERDLVEMLMFYSVRVRDTRDSAVLLMERFNGDIRHILDADKKSLCEISGVGAGSADLFKLVGKIIHRLEMPTRSISNINTADAAIDLFTRSFQAAPRGKLHIAYFDCASRPIAIEVSDVCLGKLTTEIIMSFISTARRRNAPRIAAAYFTDDPMILPTTSDHASFESFRRLIRLSGITLTDCFIENAESIYSFALERIINNK